ncbi:hypothetical protein [Candidatus Enterovibrio escicola]|uniref:Uncharacterized protein n=1 Tax=Candidatus Enterovibrio escicola TaxID=1927127 RepID=A0A2A5SZB4_9GAMM|nr:hypothetical protein [Candidatus Enterovibrio escacola]PCS21254.1 hypothetical protein BTN49_3142 [Candidatus Enterovibrio escacola]
MAKWEEWLQTDTSKKDKFNLKSNEDFDNRLQRAKKGRRKVRINRTICYDIYPFI